MLNLDLMKYGYLKVRTIEESKLVRNAFMKQNKYSTNGYGFSAGSLYFHIEEDEVQAHFFDEIPEEDRVNSIFTVDTLKM